MSPTRPSPAAGSSSRGSACACANRVPKAKARWRHSPDSSSMRCTGPRMPPCGWLETGVGTPAYVSAVFPGELWRLPCVQECSVGDGGHEGLKIVAAVVPVSVDEKGRRAVHPAAHSTEKIFAHPRRVYAERHLACKLVDVQPDSCRVRQQVLVVECVLMLEELIVHLPELALRSGGFSCLGSPFGVRMDATQREVAKGEPQSISQ